ncbi:MAG: sulfatase, partial [Thermoanaerobaculia bacterium]
RGFDWFEDFDLTSKETLRQKVRAEEVVDAAAEWLQSVHDQRFFLFLHFYDPHYGYSPPTKYRELFDTGYRGERNPYWRYSFYKENPLPAELLAHEISLYDGEIRYVDDQLRRFVDLLESMRLWKTTLLLITSDHGEEFFERGSWGHAHTLYDEQVRVPLIVSGAGVKGSRRVAAQVRHIDLLPTLLEAVRLPIPAELGGQSLWPLLQGRASEPGSGRSGERPAFIETSRFGTNLAGLRRGRWKFIADFITGQELLFDVSRDPGETENLARTQPQITTRLRSQTIAALEQLLPDLWMLRWPSEGKAPLTGELHTTGALVAPTIDGQGRVGLQGPGTMQVQLEPGATLKFRVLPVDAKVSMRASPTSDGQAVPVVLGRAGRSVARFPFRVSSRKAFLHSRPPVLSSPAALLWLEPSERLSEEVVLDEKEKERLRALGYVVR